jgi:hypothetical protein
MSLPESPSMLKNLFTETTVDGINIIDLWSSWKLTEEVKAKIKGQGEVFVEEGDSWHSISEQIYGTRDYWWVLALFNEVEDPFSIFFNKKIATTNSRIKAIRPEYIDIIVNDVRTKRVQKELSRFKNS